MKVNQILNQNCVRRAGVCDKGPAHSGVSVNPEHCQIVIKQSGNHKHDLFRLGRWNVDPLHDKAGETVETLNRRKIDICCAQEVLWRGASTRTVTGKNSQYKFFWIGNETGDGGVGTFVAKKCRGGLSFYWGAGNFYLYTKSNLHHIKIRKVLWWTFILLLQGLHHLEHWKFNPFATRIASSWTLEV